MSSSCSNAASSNSSSGFINLRDYCEHIEEFNQLKNSADTCLESVLTAHQLLTQSVHYITTGCDKLNSHLHGGIPRRGITQISGESGVGKSQLCMQLSLTAQHSEANGGLHGSVVYICTEDPFPAKRFRQMAELYSVEVGVDAETMMRHVFIEHVSDSEQLSVCLDSRVRHLIGTKGVDVKLIILDSIAGPFRGDYEPGVGGPEQRARELVLINHSLRKLVKYHNVVVVCTNQVTDDIANNETISSLGLSWNNNIDTHLVLCRDFHKSIRWLDIRQPAWLYQRNIPIEIDAKGVRSQR